MVLPPMDERQNNLALFPGATRRQNVACDNCRGKKVRCRRLTIAQRCEQCVQKDLECTSNYIEQLQSKPRRPRRFRSNEDRSAEADDDDQRPPVPSTSGPPVRQHSASTSSASRRDDIGVQDAMAMIAWMTPPPHSTVFVRPTKDAGATQADLLRYLFSPTPVLHHEWRYSDVSAMDQARAEACDMWDEDNGAIWEEPVTAAHLNLWASGETGLEAAATELLDSFFTIVHTRLPILDPEQFLNSFRSPGSEGMSIPHALLAVVLALGAKFTEHAAFVGDREESSARNGRGRSRLIQLLSVRAREVVEVNKAFRTVTMENAQALIFLEALSAQSLHLRRDYRAVHLTTAARHLERVAIADPSTVSLATDDRTRALVTLYVMSSFECALFRLRPGTFETLTLQANPLLMTTSSISGDAGAKWLAGARSAAGINHKLSNELWRPQSSASGIPISTLREFIHEYGSWRDQHLPTLGLPVPWPESWDFGKTLRACSNDIMYHALWLVVEGAVRDFSIQEPPDGGAMPGSLFALEAAQTSERLKSEAMHAAMRIAMLSALATEQGFLRIDPLILYKPIFDAGMYLARQGREDCLGCVAGLRQYAGPYPQMLDCALEIQKTFIEAAPQV